MAVTPAAPPQGRGGSPAQPNNEPRQSDDQDEGKVLAFVKDRIQKDVKANAPRRARNRADLRHLQLYRGGEDNHWSVWDPDNETYVPRPQDSSSEAALPPWFFRATTNLFANKVDGVCSILNQSQPAQELSPAQDNESDRAAAEVAEEALPQLYEECGYASQRATIHKLITLTNAVAVHVFYDNDPRHGTAEMPMLGCQACGAIVSPHESPEETTPCPECGAGPVTDAYFPEGHPQAGFPVTDQVPTGKLEMRVLSSFEHSIPRSAKELDEERVPWIASHGRMAPEEIASLWDVPKELLEPESTAKSANTASESVQFADRMRALSSPQSGGETRGAGSQATISPAGPIVWMVWSDPVDDGIYYFPDGLYAVVLEDQTVLEMGPLPVKDEKGRPVKNVLLRSYQAAPGSPYGKPPADDMDPLQHQLNMCLALAFLILMHEASPTTWVPDTVTLLDELNGMPGSTVRFKSLRAGDKPIMSEGSGFPTSLQWFIEYLTQQFDVVSKLNAVLMGARPEGGDPTAFEVNVLQERGMAAFREPLDGLVEFEKRLSRLLLRTAKASAWSPRFYSTKGDNGEWEVKQFMGADLAGDVTIHVDPMSAWPRSSVTQNLRLDQAIQAGILNPQDPEVQAEYLSLNDLASFKKSLDEDRAQVARELDAWRGAADEGQPAMDDPSGVKPPDPLWNLPFHFYKKVQWLKTEVAEKCAAERPQTYQAIRNQIMQIQFLMAPPQAPPQPGQEGGGPPDGSAVDAAVGGGALAPAKDPNQKPDGSAVDAAMASGALAPAPGGPA